MTDKEPVAEQALVADETRPHTTWAEARGCLEEAKTYWLATVRPDARPHVMPVLAVWVAGALHFVAAATSRKARNLAHGSHCVITTGVPGLDLVVEGNAVRVTDEVRLQHVAEAYASKYDWHVTVRDCAFYGEGAPTAGPPPYEVYELTPTVAFGLGTDESHGATCWRFQ